jgi:hypothetical protein
MKNKIGTLVALIALALTFHANVASAYYDPGLGRFIQPDTIIPDLSNPQSYNRYSYVLNNPLRYTDPTGHGPTDYIPLGIGPGIAGIRGNMALESQAQRAGYTSYAQAQQALGIGHATVGNVSAVAAVGQVTAGTANAYITAGQEIATAGMATGPMLIGRTAQAVTRGAEAGTAETAATTAATGGRLGSQATRDQIADVAGKLENKGWKITGGGGKAPEEYIPGPSGTKGSSYPDITAQKNGQTLRVNTIDTRANGVTPTTREANNATRIQSQKPNDTLILVPKPSQ